jgi:hypothetical protein
MELICKMEALRPDGIKVMQFTKGNKYKAIKVNNDIYHIKDDNGNVEEFWNIDIMFNEFKKDD